MKEITKTEEELLIEEAKGKYPVGTIFKVAHNNNKVVVKEHTLIVHKQNAKFWIDIKCEKIRAPSDYFSWCCIYSDGKWAEIEDKETLNIINKFVK